MPRLDEETVATLRQRIREANATVTELANEFDVDHRTIRWHAKKEEIVLPIGKRGRKPGTKNKPHPCEKELEDLREKVIELLRVLALPPETIGRRQMLARAVEALNTAVDPPP